MVFTNVCLHHWQIDKSAASMELDWYLNRSKNYFHRRVAPCIETGLGVDLNDYYFFVLGGKE